MIEDDIEILCCYCNHKWVPSIYAKLAPKCHVCGEKTNLKLLRNHKIDYYADGKIDAKKPETDDDLC